MHRRMPDRHRRPRKDQGQRPYCTILSRPHLGRGGCARDRLRRTRGSSPDHGGLVLQLSLLVDQEFGGLSFPVAGFGDGLMEPAPERPSENEVDAEAGAQLKAGDEAADLGHAEGNWDECARSSAPFWPARLTRIAARKASASIDRVMCRYQPCQLRTS